MTPEERNMLTDLANKIAQTPAPPRDADAEELIRTRIGARPDALYIMTQTVLMQGLALQQTQRQIQDLQQRSGGPSPVSAGSFLGSSGQQSNSYSQQPSYAQQQNYSQPPPLPYQQQGPVSGGGGFLRGAAQTAAGVAAGALAFEGISSMFHGIEHGFGGGGYGGGNLFGGGDRPEETVINNYYDSPAGGHERSSFLGGDDTANTDYGDANSLDDSQFADDSAGAGLDDSFDDSGDSLV